MRYKVRLWRDPYNERGQYQEIVQEYGNKLAALLAADNADYERAIVIDTSRTVRPDSKAHVVLLARGF